MWSIVSARGQEVAHLSRVAKERVIDSSAMAKIAPPISPVGGANTMLIIFDGAYYLIKV